MCRCAAENGAPCRETLPKLREAVAGHTVCPRLTGTHQKPTKAEDVVLGVGRTGAFCNANLLCWPQAAMKKGEGQKAGSGKYFPATAVQRWDATQNEIENGIYVGHLAALTFKGPYVFEGVRLTTRGRGGG